MLDAVALLRVFTTGQRDSVQRALQRDSIQRAAIATARQRQVPNPQRDSAKCQTHNATARQRDSATAPNTAYRAAGRQHLRGSFFSSVDGNWTATQRPGPVLTIASQG